MTLFKYVGLIAFLVMSSFFSAAQNDPSLWEQQADTLLSHENFKEAIRLYTKVIEKSALKREEDYKPLYKRAYAYYGIQDYEHALKDVNQYLTKIQEPQAQLLLAYIHQGMGNKEALIKDLNAFVNDYPDNGDLRRWRASVLMDIQKYAEAQEDLRLLLKYEPDEESMLYMGLTHYYLGNIDSAFFQFDRAIAANPSSVQPYIFAGSLCLEDGYYEKAIVYCNKGLEKEPGNTTLLYYKGAALIENNRKDEGCACLRKAFYNGFDDAADYLKEYCFGENEE
jgi:tetratricopeptide (TPR) repeat protein